MTFVRTLWFALILLATGHGASAVSGRPLSQIAVDAIRTRYRALQQKTGGKIVAKRKGLNEVVLYEAGFLDNRVRARVWDRGRAETDEPPGAALAN